MIDSYPATTPQMVRCIAEIACARGYRFEILDDLTGNLARVSSGEAFFLTGGGRLCPYPLNRATPLAVAKDKAHCNAVLKHAGFCVPDGRHFFIRADKRELRPDGCEFADAFAYADALGYPVFVKPISASGGNGAGAVHDPEELAYRLIEIAAIDWAVLIQPFLQRREFRIFIVDGDIQFLYEKRRPRVLGDGVSTIAQLLGAKYGPQAFASPEDHHQTLLAFHRYLLAHGHDLEHRPKAGDVIELSSIANVSSVGEIHRFCEPAAWLQSWARRLGTATQLRVLGVDVMGDLDDEAPPEPPVILEVNGAPALLSVLRAGRRDLVDAVWGRIMDTYFAEAKA